MDKRDFYKQLMSEYTFDKEKIRRNAKRDVGKAFRALNSKWLPLASAAAVFVAVFGGYMLMGQNTTIERLIERPSIASISPGQRILETEVKLLGAQELSSSLMYLSFESPLSLTEIEFALGLLSDTGEIEVLMLYDKGLIEKTMTFEAQRFTGAKISAPISMLSGIRELNVVVFVDLAGSINDDNFTPLTEHEVRNAEITLPPIQPIQSVQPVQTVQTTPAETTARAVDIPPETTRIDNEPGMISDDELPELTDDAQTSPIEITILPLQIDGAHTVEFINDDHFLVLTGNAAEIYRIVTEPQRDFELIADYTIINPRVSNINYDRRVFMLTGEDVNSVRNQLYVVTGETLAFTAIDMNLNGAWLTYAYPYPDGSVLSKAKAYDHEAFYFSRLVSGQYETQLLCDFPIQAPLLSVNGSRFIYALSDDGGSSLFEFETATKKWTELNFTTTGKTTFVRSADLTNFAVLAPDGTWIYDALTGNFIQAQAASTLRFSRADVRYFSLDEQNYLISAGTIVPTQAAVSDEVESLSNLYTIFSISDSDVKFKVN
ncbi:MAG: hypothetical protein FWH05_05445 [Oscillospiraceae bacterium]|nr:hypothetical protein [Oscillospiraceae bacterium]